MAERRFGVLVLTHQRPNNQSTTRALRRGGYSGPIWYVVDDMDPTLTEYQRLYGDSVVVFSKAEMSNRFDMRTNVPIQNVVVYARNAAFDIARDLGLTHFLELDDDYRGFEFRFMRSRIAYTYRARNLDAVFEACSRFLDCSQISAVCMMQGGDFIGGVISTTSDKIQLFRKAMNAFFLRTDRPFRFDGALNEDVNAYVTHGMRGVVFLSTNLVSVDTKLTQQRKGGLTDAYLEQGTYCKSMYTVIGAPSSVSCSMMGESHKRIHHKIDWKRAVPMIVREQMEARP